jgi:hypothetical protein
LNQLSPSDRELLARVLTSKPTQPKGGA